LLQQEEKHKPYIRGEAQAWIKNAPGGVFEIYPESETVFFDKVTGTLSTFTKNEKAAVTAIILHMEGQRDCEGKKVKNGSE